MFGHAQFGLVTRRQLLAAGISPKALRVRRERGQLVTVAPGVYAVGHNARRDLAAEAAAILSAPPGSVLSHLTAARLWSLLPLEGAPGEVSVLIPSSTGQRRARLSVHRTVLAGRVARCFVQRLPVTDPTQTLLDLGPLLTRRECERALDEALARGLVTLATLRRAADLNPRRPAVGLLLDLCDVRTTSTITRSEAEERLLSLVREAGLPQPRVNARLHGFTVDFHWPQAGLVVELDGYKWHVSRSAFDRDRRKDATMVAHGLEMLRLTWPDVTTRRLETAARLSARITARLLAARQQAHR